MLEAFEQLVAFCRIQKVYLIDVKIVVSQNLPLVNVLTLVDVLAVHIKNEFLSESLLDLLHLGVITEREVIYCVCEIEWATVHIKLLNDRTKGVGGEMEITGDLIDNDCPFNKTAFIIIHSLDGLFIYLFSALASIREMSIIVHDIMDANVVPVAI